MPHGFLDRLVQHLATDEIKNTAVICPSMVALRLGPNLEERTIRSGDLVVDIDVSDGARIRLCGGTGDATTVLLEAGEAIERSVAFALSSRLGVAEGIQGPAEFLDWREASWRMSVKLTFHLDPSMGAAAWSTAAPIAFLVLWSSGFVFLKVGLTYSDPLTFLALRYACVIGLLACGFRRSRPRIPIGSRPPIPI